MRRLLLSRLLWMVPTFVAITLVTFLVAHLAPGDPLSLGDELAPQVAASDDARPLFTRYLVWLGRFVTLELGRSTVDGAAVSSRIARALPVTLLVSVLALTLSVVTSVTLGVSLARNGERRWARFVNGLLATASGVPSLWVAVVLLLLLASPRGVVLFPLQGLGDGPVDAAWHLVLPVLCVSWPLIASLTRHVREGTVAALQQDFVLAARARGVPEPVVLRRHALPVAFVPLVTVMGLQLRQLVAGSVVIERLFGLPGMGLLAWDAIGTRDYPMVMGVSTVIGAVTLLATLLADLAAAAVDPRIRLPELE